MKIPFNRPLLAGHEFAYIRDAIRRNHLAGDGYYTQACSRWLEKNTAVSRALLTSSCTHALEMAYLLLAIKPGDQVILPSYTFPSTANAFVLRGGIPRFVDIRADTLNMDESLLDGALTARTRAISPVHYAGVPCEMTAIAAFARRHHLAVIEDAAQALGASYHGQPAGSFGALNAVSFHETKNFSCGEGGALLITEKRYIERAEILRQKGTNRAKFLRGDVDKYSWVDVGSSYVPSELQSAYLFAQLARNAWIHKRRQAVYTRYREALAPLEKKGVLKLPVIPAHCVSSYHLFHVILNTARERDRVLAQLQRQGISAVIHYMPLHLSKMGRQFGYRRGQFPVTESLSARLLRLPIYTGMTPREQDVVLQALSRI